MKSVVSVGMLSIAAVALLSACQKDPPKCGDKETLSIIRNIIVDSLGGAGSLDKKDIETVLQFEYPRADSYDKDIKKYSCSANLVVTQQETGRTWKNAIEYTSQLDDNNQHIAGINGLQGSVTHIYYVFDQMKRKKAQEVKEDKENPEAGRQ